MYKIAFFIIATALIIGMGVVFWGQSKNDSSSSTTASVQTVEMRDGVQYVTVHARGGYSPKVSYAQADIPTRLVMKTNGTYDCSAALVIRSIGYQTILPHTGEEIIDIGVPQAGKFQGVCSMGMYSFTIYFR